jgi:hypothetical protein
VGPSARRLLFGRDRSCSARRGGAPCVPRGAAGAQRAEVCHVPERSRASAGGALHCAVPRRAEAPDVLLGLQPRLDRLERGHRLSAASAVLSQHAGACAGSFRLRLEFDHCLWNPCYQAGNAVRG